MNMAKQKTTETTKYYSTCPDCGKEYQVADASVPDEPCYRCRTKLAVGHAKEKLLHLIGATVICIDPIERGAYTSEDEIESVEIKLADGRYVLFSVAGFSEDSYIEWNLRNQS
jgi:hypothetical protein